MDYQIPRSCLLQQIAVEARCSRRQSFVGNMSATDISVVSQLWRTLILHGDDMAVEELVRICRLPSDDEESAACFESKGKLLKFVKSRPYHFKYIRTRDTVDLQEGLGISIEGCLVEFVALKVKASIGSLQFGDSWFDNLAHTLPRCMALHMYLLYGGSLELFIRSHPVSFTTRRNNVVRLAPSFWETSILEDSRNMEVVYFFLGLLQKLGATVQRPCPLHTAGAYVQYMERDARVFFKNKYGSNMAMFLLLNGRYFIKTGKTESKEGFGICHRKPATKEYGSVAYVKQQLHFMNASSKSTSLALGEVMRLVNRPWCSPIPWSLTHPGKWKVLGSLLKRHPNIFKERPDGKVCLQGKYCAWKREWSTKLELLAVDYFSRMLADIGATCESSPVPFNYILHAVKSAPAECKDYLMGVFPLIDIIDLFHLYPKVFDISFRNCVALKSRPVQCATPGDEPADQLSIRYALRLLKYVGNLTPALFRTCAEVANANIRMYCCAPVRGRTLDILMRAKILQASGSDGNTGTALDPPPLLGPTVASRDEPVLSPVAFTKECETVDTCTETEYTETEYRLEHSVGLTSTTEKKGQQHGEGDQTKNEVEMEALEEPNEGQDSCSSGNSGVDPLPPGANCEEEADLKLQNTYVCCCQ